ncbi:hypothetical protein BS50DRAFT_590753 [Corynespora cassiicola Philippines]|uniref:Uncharacterized protein n=1 Tax=Corynespora cassiicola Philippines TaxID=1448308 RepID=A0A2T2NER2_CORCC|nr:hypothetical protein BS50DRAFT_590753 [Corynespora cassiicola Philippines]
MCLPSLKFPGQENTMCMYRKPKQEERPNPAELPMQQKLAGLGCVGDVAVTTSTICTIKSKRERRKERRKKKRKPQGNSALSGSTVSVSVSACLRVLLSSKRKPLLLSVIKYPALEAPTSSPWQFMNPSPTPLVRGRPAAVLKPGGVFRVPEEREREKKKDE